LPLNEEALLLEPSPRSVKDARRWVSRACARLGRLELLDSAELGISELVTNAILHGGPPLSVRMRGTHAHPRIEVADSSQRPPRPNPRMTDDDELLSTVGRGLGLVARCANAWGAYIQPEGKIVWFEPAAGFSEAPDIDGDVYTLPSRPDWAVDHIPGGIEVHLVSLPVKVMHHYRQHYRELRRELRLLSLAHESEYPIARHVTELFARSEEELRVAQGAEEFGKALSSGRESVDVTVVVPQSAPETMVQLEEMLELADEFCRSQRLLSLATTPQQRQFQSWLLGEFVRQGRGEAPLPWAGSAQVQDYTQNAS
jgi:anti-sigma regulatory factor (Ser/Thr protein kinase)